jgi:hypothetical protein
MRATAWLLVFLCLVPLVAQQSGAESTTVVILALERAWFAAESRGDNQGLNLLFDSALVYVEDGRLVNKGEYLTRVRLARSHPQQVVAETAIVHMFGNTASVVGIYREVGVRDGKASPRRWRYIDTWVNKKGTWMLVAAGSSPLRK